MLVNETRDRERLKHYNFAFSKKKHPRAFTPEENNIILDNLPAKAQELLPHRSRQVITQQRWKLKQASVGGEHRLWTKGEIKTLRKVYPLEDWPTIQAALPGRSKTQIVGKAVSLKIRRIMRNMDEVHVFGHMEIADQIRERLRADGISIAAFGRDSGTGDYFYKGKFDKTQAINLHQVVKALDYFGAKLTVDWNDR